MTRAKKEQTAKLLTPYVNDPLKSLMYQCKICGLIWKMINPKMKELRRHISNDEFKKIADQVNQYNYDNFVKAGGFNDQAVFNRLSENLNKSIRSNKKARFAKCPRGCSYWQRILI